MKFDLMQFEKPMIITRVH